MSKLKDRLVSGAKIRTLRTSKGLSAAQFAKQVQCSKKTILALERDERNPSILVALHIASELGVTIEQLFDPENDDIKVREYNYSAPRMYKELAAGNGKAAALFKERYAQRIRRTDLAKKIGVVNNSLYFWESGRIDPFLNAESWANALGYELVLREKTK